MRTTLNIDDYIFNDLQNVTKAKTKTEAVRIALKEYLRMKRKEQVLSMRGKIDIVNDWQKLRHSEVAEYSDDYCE